MRTREERSGRPMRDGWSLAPEHRVDLAAWCDENALPVVRLRREAGLRDTDGPEQRLRAAYEHLRDDWHPTYAQPLRGARVGEQRIRLPGEVLDPIRRGAGGTCLDLALLLAAVVGNDACRPLIAWRGQRGNHAHAVIGAWRHAMAAGPPLYGTEAAIRDVAADAIWVEPTGVCRDDGYRLEFDEARRAASELAATPGGIEFIVDIHQARREEGIEPHLSGLRAADLRKREQAREDTCGACMVLVAQWERDGIEPNWGEEFRIAGRAGWLEEYLNPLAIEEEAQRLGFHTQWVAAPDLVRQRLRRVPSPEQGEAREVLERVLERAEILDDLAIGVRDFLVGRAAWALVLGMDLSEYDYLYYDLVRAADGNLYRMDAYEGHDHREPLEQGLGVPDGQLWGLVLLLRPAWDV